MTDRIPAAARLLLDEQKQAAGDLPPVAETTSMTTSSARPTRPNNDASGAKILAAGASIAAGIGLVGVMAAAATADAPAAMPVSVPGQRIIVIQQPTTMQPVVLPANVGATPAAPAAPAEVPRIVVIEADLPAQPAPKAVTVSAGS